MGDNRPSLSQKPNDFLSPGSFIRAARAAHPAFRFAIAIAGILAIVATFARFGVSYATLIFGAIAIIALMALFLVFAQAAKLAKATLDLPAKVFIWSFLLLGIAISFGLASSVFFNNPLPFRDFIVEHLPGDADVPTADRAIARFHLTFHFAQPVFNIAPSPTLNFGFTSLEHDTSLEGKVQITKITMIVQTANKSDNVFGDMWVFLAPTVITGKQSGNPFPVGPGTLADIRAYPWDLLSDAPTQLKLTFGRSEPVTASYKYIVTYDFTTNLATLEPALQPLLTSSTKSVLNPPMELTNGLYAQMFIWTGAPRADIDIDQARMEVEGIYFGGGHE
jgi:hypothetical protein